MVITDKNFVNYANAYFFSFFFFFWHLWGQLYTDLLSATNEHQFISIWNLQRTQTNKVEMNFKLSLCLKKLTLSNLDKCLVVTIFETNLSFPLFPFYFCKSFYVQPAQVLLNEKYTEFAGFTKYIFLLYFLQTFHLVKFW